MPQTFRAPVIDTYKTLASGKSDVYSEGIKGLELNLLLKKAFERKNAVSYKCITTHVQPSPCWL